MVRLALRGAVGVLSAALLTACLGGQTGQPTRANCEEKTTPAVMAWNGTTLGAAAASLAGTYEAELAWRAEPRSSPTQTPVALQDTVTLSVAYDGEDGVEACWSDLVKVPVTVSLTTSASGIAENGSGTLELWGASGSLQGNLGFRGERVAVLARLEQGAAGVTLSGSLDALDGELPGASAAFGAKP